MGERQLDLGLGLIGTAGGPFQEQTRQAFGRGVRQAEAADLLVGGLAILAEMLRGLQAGVAVLLEEGQESRRA